MAMPRYGFLADRPDAIPLIAGWYHEQWGYRSKQHTAEYIAANLRGNLQRDRVPLQVLALHGDSILGTAELKYHEMDLDPEREYWLGGVFVAMQYRGRGIATGLIERVVEIARSMGVDKLYLQTERMDGGLYRRLGWQPCQQVYYHGMHVLVMERRLAPHSA